MVARVVPQSARRRHAESRKPDLWGWAARPKAPVLTISEERDGVLSILASSSKPEGTSVSSSGLDMSVRSKSGSTCGNVRDEALIRSPARSLHRGGRGGRSLGKALAARGSAALRQ